ncbi:GDSL-type esterase/lipase family protein [Metaclostridioides mangenotii]|uniref:Lysophospholipase L1-like esterase n=1 Tax=Metaclostridioides mangenotii TaxID=1540 RepID=A0ABS4EB49_9FIRM|nr:GDSL-type esterase/lipase family protein [Clostridioides mangenotii]MBP1855165.1 lysophospholipase L1-like esterase [Clostridioides mangenotii]
MKIVCLGDSLTYGYGVKRSESWCRKLEEKLNATILNKGINGDTTSGMLARFERDVLAEKPDVLLFIGGTNDIFLSENTDIAKNNIAAIVQQSLSVGILPIIGCPTPIHEELVEGKWKLYMENTNIVETLKQYHEWLNLYSNTYDVKLIDFYTEFYSDNIIQDKLKYYLDGIHLTGEGNSLIADIIYKKLREFDIL